MFKHNDRLTIKSISFIYEREIHKLFYSKSKSCHLKNEASKRKCRTISHKLNQDLNHQWHVLVFKSWALQSQSIPLWTCRLLSKWICRNKMFSFSHTPSIKETTPRFCFTFCEDMEKNLKWRAPACPSKSRTQDPPAKKNRVLLRTTKFPHLK